MKMRKILVPLDFSEEGERAMKAVAELAAATRAAVVLLHVIENVGVAPVGEGSAAPVFLAGTKEELELARKTLEERRKAFPGGVEVTGEAIVAPSVPHAINDYAAKNACDVIALSTHGRTGFRRMLMGSVAEAVLRGARVPVLAFPRVS